MEIEEHQRYFEGMIKLQPDRKRWQSGIDALQMWHDLGEKDELTLSELMPVLENMSVYTYKGSGWYGLSLSIIGWLRSQPPDLQASAMATLLEKSSQNYERYDWAPDHKIVKMWMELLNQDTPSRTDVKMMLDEISRRQDKVMESYQLALMIDEWAQAEFSMSVDFEKMNPASK